MGYRWDFLYLREKEVLVLASVKRTRRVTHSISVAPGEWERIQARAEAAGMPVSRYLVARALEPVQEPQPGSQPPAWLEHITHRIELLAMLEERRVTEQAGPEVWQQVVADVDAIVAAQRIPP